MEAERRAENRCPACYGDKVTKGRLGDPGGSPRFELPPQQRGFWGTLGPTVALDEPAYLCLGCGLVWTYADKLAATEAIARAGNDELLDSLGMVKRPKRKWTWLLFGRR
jgi:hypothetical protein